MEALERVLRERGCVVEDPKKMAGMKSVLEM